MKYRATVGLQNMPMFSVDVEAGSPKAAEAKVRAGLAISTTPKQELLAAVDNVLRDHGYDPDRIRAMSRPDFPFKMGDRIQHVSGTGEVFTVTKVDMLAHEAYAEQPNGVGTRVINPGNWKVVP